jgi:hypothetical protein
MRKMSAAEKLPWLLILGCVKKYACGFHFKKSEARSTKYETISKYEFSNVLNFEKKSL